MSKIKSENIIKKLVLIKYLFFIGEEQSRQLGASAGFSILAFHDCVEMLLVLIAHYKRKRTQRHFLEYWNEIPDLPYKGEMDNLNNVRVSLKHNATFPSREEITRCRDDVRLFLTDSINRYFEKDFDTISISDLIMFDEVKKYIEEAEILLKEESLYEALIKCRMAFIKLLENYESDKKQWFKSIFEVGEKIGKDYEHLVSTQTQEEIWFKQVTKTTNEIRDILKVTSLGIDYKKYALFNFLTPHVKYWRSPTGEDGYTPDSESYYKKIVRTIRKEDCRFCIDFVVDSSLKLQEMQFDVNDYLNLH